MEYAPLVNYFKIKQKVITQPYFSSFTHFYSLLRICSAWLIRTPIHTPFAPLCQEITQYSNFSCYFIYVGCSNGWIYERNEPVRTSFSRDVRSLAFPIQFWTFCKYVMVLRLWSRARMQSDLSMSNRWDEQTKELVWMCRVLLRNKFRCNK